MHCFWASHVYVDIFCVRVLVWLSWECFVFFWSGNNIIFYKRPVGSQGIVGNWKSRWMSMNFEEEMDTAEIKLNMLYSVNVVYLCLCHPFVLVYFPFSSYFPQHFFFHIRAAFYPLLYYLFKWPMSDTGRDRKPHTIGGEWVGPLGPINKICANGTTSNHVEYVLYKNTHLITIVFSEEQRIHSRKENIVS